MKNLRSNWIISRLIFLHSVAVRTNMQATRSVCRRRIPGDSGMIKGEERFRIVKNQDGSVLVIALLMLVFLTLIGIASSTNTQIEIQIAGNERSYNVAFNVADSGVYMTPKIIRRTVENGVRPTLAAITYLPSDDGTFFREVMGYNPREKDPDVQFALSGYTVGVDVGRDRQINIGGGGVEFASGAEGVGVGSAGGVAVIYEMNSTGAGPNNAQSNILAEYRLIPGVAGGL